MKLADQVELGGSGWNRCARAGICGTSQTSADNTLWTVPAGDICCGGRFWNR